MDEDIACLERLLVPWKPNFWEFWVPCGMYLLFFVSFSFFIFPRYNFCYIIWVINKITSIEFAFLDFSCRSMVCRPSLVNFHLFLPMNFVTYIKTWIDSFHRYQCELLLMNLRAAYLRGKISWIFNAPRGLDKLVSICMILVLWVIWLKALPHRWSWSD